MTPEALRIKDLKGRLDTLTEDYARLERQHDTLRAVGNALASELIRRTGPKNVMHEQSLAALADWRKAMGGECNG